MIGTSDIDSRITTEFVTANGIRFEVDMCGDPASKKLALCLHGFPEHSVSWRYQLPMLADLGYRAWAPNMRGYGNSSIPPDVEDYSIENLMADVGALIDAAACEETVLIAHDWGAVVAWYFAMRKIRPLNKLVICNVPHPGAARKAFGWRQIKKSWYIFFFQIPALPEWLLGLRANGMGEMIKSTSTHPEMYPDEVSKIYSENAGRPGGLKAMINYYRSMFRPGGGAGRQQALGLPVIETPTLMCWGEDDMALTKETTYATQEWVPNLTLRYLPRISHWVQQDAAEEVNAMMSAFLQDESVPYMKWEARLVAEDPA